MDLTRIARLSGRCGGESIRELPVFVRGAFCQSAPPIRQRWFRQSTKILAGDIAANILKGKSPSEIPVEQPTEFEFAINLKTPKALGITIPQSILVRANEAIE